MRKEFPVPDSEPSQVNAIQTIANFALNLADPQAIRVLVVSWVDEGVSSANILAEFTGPHRLEFVFGSIELNSAIQEFWRTSRRQEAEAWSGLNILIHDGEFQAQFLHIEIDESFDPMQHRTMIASRYFPNLGISYRRHP